MRLWEWFGNKAIFWREIFKENQSLYSYQSFSFTYFPIDAFIRKITWTVQALLGQCSSRKLNATYLSDYGGMETTYELHGGLWEVLWQALVEVHSQQQQQDRVGVSDVNGLQEWLCKINCYWKTYLWIFFFQIFIVWIKGQHGLWQMRIWGTEYSGAFCHFIDLSDVAIFSNNNVQFFIYIQYTSNTAVYIFLSIHLTTWEIIFYC